MHTSASDCVVIRVIEKIAKEIIHKWLKILYTNYIVYS